MKQKDVFHLFRVNFFPEPKVQSSVHTFDTIQEVEDHIENPTQT